MLPRSPPGEDPVFYSKHRVRVDGSIITNIGNGFVDAEGHYWIKDQSGTSLPVSESTAVIRWFR